jgi:hypothetical protein
MFTKKVVTVEKIEMILAFINNNKYTLHFEVKRMSYRAKIPKFKSYLCLA